MLLTGTVHDVKHVALTSGVGQWATLWYGDDGGHIPLWAPPTIKYALNEVELVNVTGRLAGDHVLVEEVHAHDHA